MRIIITFQSNKLVKLPIYYNETIQGFIYKSLNKTLAEFLHNEGFKYQKRKFKLFTFSRILGKLKISNNFFEISSPFNLIISSPYKDILQAMAENLLKAPTVTLNRQKIYIESINVSSLGIIATEVFIKMLSPVTIYSTFPNIDGKKKTYYYNPKEKEFSELIAKNLEKKYYAFYNKDLDCKDFKIIPIKVSKFDEKIISYKNFIIKGWMGVYKISANTEAIRFAYDAGIGSKNSQGFGCFEIIPRA